MLLSIDNNVDAAAHDYSSYAMCYACLDATLFQISIFHLFIYSGWYVYFTFQVMPLQHKELNKVRCGKYCSKDSVYLLGYCREVFVPNANNKIVIYSTM